MLRLRSLYLLVFLSFLVGCASAPPEEAQALLARGDSALNRLAYGDAARLYGEAADLDPDFAEAYSRQGLALWAAQQFEQAIPVLDRAIELDPDDARAYYYRGSSLLALDRFEESVDDLRAATERGALDPEDVRRAHHLRSVALMNLERYDDATAAVTDAITAAPDHVFYYLERARLHDFSGRTEAAIDDYTAFLDRGASGDLAAEAERRRAALRGDAPADSTEG